MKGLFSDIGEQAAQDYVKKKTNQMAMILLALFLKTFQTTGSKGNPKLSMRFH